MDRNEYVEFVDSVTSPESKNYADFVDRVLDLQLDGLDVPRVLTAAIGMTNEAGEFGEYVKKMLFQGKAPSNEVRNEMKSELGDVLWYFTQACLALGFSMEDIQDANVEKLRGRFKGDKFNARMSEARYEN